MIFKTGWEREGDGMEDHERQSEKTYTYTI